MPEVLAKLQKLRAALLERRRDEAHSSISEHEEERIKTLGHLHLAIEAIDEVIKTEPDEVDRASLRGRRARGSAAVREGALERHPPGTRSSTTSTRDFREGDQPDLTLNDLLQHRRVLAQHFGPWTPDRDDRWTRSERLRRHQKRESS